MFAKTLLKNPIFTLGLILMGLFLYQLSNDGKLGLFDRQKLLPTSCSAVVANLNKRIPATWTPRCEGQVLIMQIEMDLPADLPTEELKRNMVREMANNLYHIARSSPAENLERTPFVVVKLTSQKMEVNARTAGAQLIRLATLSDQKLIAEHLKATVETQIVSK